jgi:tetratricopeptide (TPR) repeat protein
VDSEEGINYDGKASNDSATMPRLRIDVSSTSQLYSLALSERIILPTMEEITQEILRHPKEKTKIKEEEDKMPQSRLESREHDDGDDDDDDENDEPRYKHDDEHPSNMHRFYLLNGLASSTTCDAIENGGVALTGPTSPRGGKGPLVDVADFAAPKGQPLTFFEIASSGLVSLRARTRLDATRTMINSELFYQFVKAAAGGGFFLEKNQRSSKSGDQSLVPLATRNGNEYQRQIYEEKYRKVVGKFQTKIAIKELLSQMMNQKQSYNPQPPQISNSHSNSQRQRLSSAYKIMSGTASVSSQDSRAIDTFSMKSLNDVVERRHRRIENNKIRFARTLKQTQSSNISGPNGVKFNRNSLADQTKKNLFLSYEVEEEVVVEQGAKGQTFFPPTPKFLTSKARETRGTAQPKQETPMSPIPLQIFPRTSPRSPTATIDEVTSNEETPPTPMADPAVVNLPHYQEAERLNELGNSLMKQRNFQSALDNYSLAIDLAPAGPNSHIYYSNRSAACLSLNMNEHSILDCERSIALIKPGEDGEGEEYYAKALSRLGLAYFACKRYREAVSAYEKSLEANPNNELTRQHLANAMAMMNSSVVGCIREEGEEEFETRASTTYEEVLDDIVEEAEVKENGNEEVSYTRSETNHLEPGKNGAAPDPPGGDGTAEDDSRDDNTSIEKTNSSLWVDTIPLDDEKEREAELAAIAEQNVQADKHKNKGNDLMSNKKYAAALMEYDLAIEISPRGPNSYVYYSNRAAAYCYLTNYADATNDCKRSIELNPMYEKAYARLGLSLFFQAQYKEAIVAYERSIELNPNNKASLSYLSKAKTRLEEQEEKRTLEEKENKNNDERRKRMQLINNQQRNSSQRYNPSPIVEEMSGDISGDECDGDSQTSTGLTTFVTNNEANVGPE